MHGDDSPILRLLDIPPLTAGNVSIALLGLPLFALLEQTIVPIDPVGEIVIQWGLAAGVVSIAVVAERQSFTDIGFRRPSWVDLAYALVTALAALLVFAGTDPLVTALGLSVASDTGTMTAGVGLGVAVAGAVTAGIIEEVLFRGYAIERLLEYTGSSVVAGGFAWGLFTAAHAAVWPPGNLLQIAAVAAVFTGVYLRRRTLFPVIGAHVVVWVVSAVGQFYG